MKIGYVYRALTVGFLTCSVAAITPGVVRAHGHGHDNDGDNDNGYIQNTTPKADQDYVESSSPKAEHRRHHDDDDDYGGIPKGHVTLVGCFLRTTDSDGDHVRYVLSDAKLGPAGTVADQNCAGSGTGQLIRLKHADDVGLDQVMSGRWLEMYGELGKPRDADDMRKFEVKSFREVPLTPRVAIITIPATPAPAVETPAPEPQAIAPVETPQPEPTTGVEKIKRLPKTASSMPLVGALGLFALTGGLVLALVDRRRALRRA